MQRNLLSAVSAAALSLALLGAAPAYPQDDTTARGLAVLGMQAPLDTLSTEQVGQIQNVLSSTENDEVKRQRIKEILGNEATATGRLGVGQLQASVSSDLAALGIDTSGVNSLTLTQLAEIEGAMSTNDPDDIKKAKVGEIMGGEAINTGRLGVTQLRDSAAGDLAKLGVDPDDIDALTLSQLAQIENVVSSGATDAEKKAQVTTILAQ